MVKKYISKNKIILILALILIIITYKISDYFYIGQYTQVKEGICENDNFRNPKMKENTLYELKTMAEEKKLNFTKLVATTMVVNDFNLEKTNINEINVKRYNLIYKRLLRDEEFSEYMKAIAAIISDVRCFPVVKVNDYGVSFEDSFGSARSFNGNYSHEGTDLMAQINESGIYPIVSVSDGVVEKVGWLQKGGYRVGIRGKSGGYFYYAHLHKDSITVEEGDSVKAGQLIGYMGDSGYGEEGTTGKFPVHLHFGIYIKTKEHEELSVNPYYILKYLEQLNHWQ